MDMLSDFENEEGGDTNFTERNCLIGVFICKEVFWRDFFSVKAGYGRLDFQKWIGLIKGGFYKVNEGFLKEI